MRRPREFAVYATCLFLTGGCFPYLYPRLHHTPRIKLSKPTDEVHAFRVEIGKSTMDVMRTECDILREVPVNHRDVVPAQTWPSFAVGFAMFGPLTYICEGSSTMALRVYRPGYKLVEFRSWEQKQEIVWEPAPILQDQIDVLDELFPVHETAMGAPTSLSRRLLAPGSVASSHRQALQFGASEFERLALTAESTEQHSLLMNKAEQLRQRAEE